MKKYILPIFSAVSMIFASCEDNDIIPADKNSYADLKAEVAVQGAISGQMMVRLNSSDLHQLSSLSNILGEVSVEPLFPTDSRRVAQSRAAGMDEWYLMRFSESANMASAYRAIASLQGVKALQANCQIEPDLKFRGRKTIVDINKTLKSASVGFFNDPGLSHQWGYINTGDYSFSKSWAPAIAGADVNCAEAWPLCTGDPEIIVAVMDEAVMYSHPDLLPNMWVNEAETQNSDVDADGNGYAGDRYGYNFNADNSILSWDKTNDAGHGTHVAGTIAAVNDNGIGVSSIAGGDASHPGVRIMSLQIMSDGYGCSLANEARAMKYAADNGAVILQCSWGYNSYLANGLLGFTPGPASEEEWYSLYPLEKDCIDYFIHYAGSPNGVIEGGLVFFAAGNEYAAAPAFPAAYSECISVSSIAADYTPATYTNYGEGVSICAPGGDGDYYGAVGDSYSDFDVDIDQGRILSTLIDGVKPAYGYYEGTSMACPAAAGVAALGLSYAAQLHRHFKASEFKELILSTARDVNQYLSGEKLYHFNHGVNGTPATLMQLGDYRGKMGKLIDAGALLKAVQSAGADFTMPNIMTSVNKAASQSLRHIFPGVSTFSCNVANTEVASVSFNGDNIVVTGLKSGFTKATINAGSKSASFVITVR
ncbi:MAG: S8 family serine peptidase [Bacteroidia bacterium]|nr:S8 family serine peptidase [Bacteroidia bacterium]